MRGLSAAQISWDDAQRFDHVSSLNHVPFTLAADDAQSDPVVPAIGERPEVAVNVVEVLKIALAVYLAFIALFTAWLRPTASSLITGLLIGLAFGLGYAWLFYAARYKKLLLNEGVSCQSLPTAKSTIHLDCLATTRCHVILQDMALYCIWQ